MLSERQIAVIKDYQHTCERNKTQAFRHNYTALFRIWEDRELICYDMLNGAIEPNDIPDHINALENFVSSLQAGLQVGQGVAVA